MPTDRRTALKHAAAGLSLLIPGCRPAPPPAKPRVAAQRDERALRIDLRHVTGADERFLLTGLRSEPLWAGPERPTGSAPDWGDYRFDMIEPGAATLLYRSGFDSTSGGGSTSALSLRAPYPDTTVEVSIARRRAGSLFQRVWNATIDPADPAVDRSPAKAATRVETLRRSGPSSAKVDLAILGDGYREAEHPKFMADARRAADYLFSIEPFNSRAGQFNVHAAFVASDESGVTDPYLGLRRSTAFGCAYAQGMAERTLTVGNERALREAAATVPYDYLLVLANARRYGGSAYFGGPAVVSIDSAVARYLVVHELAHTVAGLAEEYYIPSGEGAVYNGNIEPWQPNVSLTSGSGKWSAPADGQWNKREYDAYFRDYVQRYLALRESRASEDRVERFMQAESRRQATLLARNARRPGYFEGAHGYARGVFRSEPDCVMFSLQTERFCTACSAAITRAIDYHAS